MGRLFDLLQAATGEAALSSALGRWRQAVSEALDAGGAGTGGTTVLAGSPGIPGIPGTPGLPGPAGNACGADAISTQPTWFVANTGNDANDGATPATALATPTELACRLNDKLIAQDTVITFSGDFQLTDFRIRLSPAPNTTTTIVGTPAAAATRTVSAFTPYNEAAKTVAVLDTAPGTLNTFTNLRIRDAATGAVGWLLASTGATTATPSYLTDFFGSDVQLNPGDTIFVEDVAATELGWIFIENTGSGDVVVRDLAIVPQVDKPMSARGGVATDTISTGRVTFFGVLFPFIVGQPKFQDSNADFFGCMWDGGVTSFSTGVYRLNGPSFQGCTPVLRAGAWVNMERVLNRASGFQMTGGAQAVVVNHGFIVVGGSGGVDISDMSFYRFSGRMWQTAAFAAPVSFGLDVHDGGGVYYGANKPELTGSVTDTKVGGTNKTYAQIPYTDALNLSRIVASTT